MARVQVLNEITDEREKNRGYSLWFQWCRYIYDDGTLEYGYRFIWRRPDKSLQAARGQARIPSIALMETLIDKAKKAGWGDYSDKQFAA